MIVVVKFIAIGMLAFVVSCSDSSELKEPIASTGSMHGSNGALEPSPGVPTELPKARTLPAMEDNCHVFDKLKDSKPPVWLQGKGVVVTRLLKDCVTFDGQEGYRKNAHWMAMGFPCTGGGKFDWRGNYYSPKFVSFLLSVDCPMFPNNPKIVRSYAEEELGLTNETKLLAFNPFALQYWEIPDFEDAGVGFSIDLRSTAAKRKLWKNFLDDIPIPVRLYGRENAWVLGKQFFYVDGELVKSGRYSFRLVIKKVKSLAKDEVEEVKKRCSALKPRRDCYKIF